MPAIKTKLKNAPLIAAGLLLLCNALLLMQRAPAQAQDPGGLAAQVRALSARVAALEAKTAPLSVAGKDLTISGVNVHIVSGSGSTSDGTKDGEDFPVAGRKLSGLGNLTIGYNERRGMGDDSRTGSHNLIVGTRNNYTSYGGLVAGELSTVSAPGASVSGGLGNTASGSHASVSGGQANTAGGFCASVSGGLGNTAGGVNLDNPHFAAGYFASISGGESNTASASYACVTGGYHNTAGSDHSTVGGGRNLVQRADYGWSAGAHGRRTGRTRRRGRRPAPRKDTGYSLPGP